MSWDWLPAKILRQTIKSALAHSLKGRVYGVTLLDYHVKSFANLLHENRSAVGLHVPRRCILYDFIRFLAIQTRRIRDALSSVIGETSATFGGHRIEHQASGVDSRRRSRET